MPSFVAGRRSITDGQKLLYERLVRYAGKDGHCYPTHKTLAGELGKTDRQIRADLKRLEKLGLINHQNRDGRKSNTYVFLWHQVFENREVGAAQEDIIEDLSGNALPVRTGPAIPFKLVERKHTSAQTEELDGSRLPVERKSSVDLSGSTLPPNSVQRIKEHTPSAGLLGRDAREWPRGGWADSEDFERWWKQLVLGHPNKSKNGRAKTKAIELLFANVLKRAEFDDGYLNAKNVAGARWTEQGSRYAPNLWQFLDDAAWILTMPTMSPAAEYQSAEEYLRRVENE